MFSHLEEDERVIVFRAMILQTFDNGATIIKQGEQGSVFYVIDSGSCDIFVEKPAGITTLVSTLSRGGSFGELALLYGSPRAASVIATSPVRCWSMDRATYHGLLACLASQKRTQYEAFLKNIPIFSPCTKWELLRIVDALQPIVYRPGDVIVRQGDPGDFFYIVLEGEVRVTKTLESGNTVMVGQLGPSRYFGELALLNNQPRASTVTAATAVRCVRVNRDGFDRVLGPCEELLRRNSQVYAQVVGVPLSSTPMAKQ
jgi:cAMP-dependent protein kinase regulator